MNNGTKILVTVRDLLMIQLHRPSSTECNGYSIPLPAVNLFPVHVSLMPSSARLSVPANRGSRCLQQGNCRSAPWSGQRRCEPGEGESPAMIREQGPQNVES